MRKRLILAAAALAGPGLAGAVVGQPRPSPPAPPQAAAPADATPVARGKYLAAAGDCIGCHTTKGGAAYAGGRPLSTPFGTIVSANITPDATGIGGWTADQFYRALHEGVDDEGKHLYPAFPYNYYTKLTRADSDAIFAYLKTVPAVRNDPKRNLLPFPLNIRALVWVWNLLFLHKGEFQPDSAKSAEWNRGAYLVQGPGHCGACHTPMNFFGAPKGGHALQGGRLGVSFAPDLTSARRTGLGGWSVDEIVEFLKTGRNVHGSASAEMGEVIAYSTSQLDPADLHAIAVYLHDQPPAPEASPSRPDPAVMRQGEAIWVDNCSACHRMEGSGVPRFFPPLKGDANVQQRDPLMTVRFILEGTRSVPTDARPTPLSMPAYNWKLDDGQVAAVATYVRNSWGNSASPVSAGDVAKLRKKLPSGPGPQQKAAPLSRPGPATLAPAGTDSRDNGGPSAGRVAPSDDRIVQTAPAAGAGASGAQNGGADKAHPGGLATPGPG